METFSERYGYTQPKQIQREVMDDDLRNSIWNFLLGKYSHMYIEAFVHDLWVFLYKRPKDEIPKEHCYECRERAHDKKFLKQIILKEKWYAVLNALEFIYAISDCSEGCNVIFEKECFSYRFVDGLICEITSEEEIKEIETASSSPVDEINQHLNMALGHLSRRENPDYRNSIKESISAVECLCRKITGTDTLGKAIGKLESQGLQLNSQLKSGLNKIYDYTNGKDGIRHAIMDDTTIKQEDARFMLVMCSSFINYIIVKANEVGIKL